VWLQYHPLHDCPKRNELLQLRHGRNARKRPDPILLVDLLLHRSPLSSRDGEEIRELVAQCTARAREFKTLLV
jgi:hypothetical protein